LYRSVVADKRMLVVLDNAVDADQVVPLLPGSPNCTVLVTSRCRLDELTVAHGARALHLDMLSDDESRELLADRVGDDRIAAEPDAVRDLVAGCAGLPLAVGVVASRLAGHPGFPLPASIAELLNAAWAAVFRVLSWSIDALSPAAALVFGLTATLPGPDIGRPAVARLLGDPGRADAVLRELVDASLLRQHAPDHYRMHDLVRRYAAARPATTGVATVV